MQTFKEIPYQNYIELKFNTKNLHEARRQEAMIKYKRNSQLLAEIFTFNQPSQNTESSSKIQSIITEQTLNQFRQQIQNQKSQANKKLQQIKNKSQLYDETIKSINAIKSKQQLHAKIQQLKLADLYDERHPFFVQNSPFFLNSTDQQILELTTESADMQQEDDWQKISLLELS